MRQHILAAGAGNGEASSLCFVRDRMFVLGWRIGSGALKSSSAAAILPTGDLHVMVRIWATTACWPSAADPAAGRWEYREHLSEPLVSAAIVLLLCGEHSYHIHTAAAFIVSSMLLLFSVFIHFPSFSEQNYNEHIPKPTVNPFPSSRLPQR